jgi:hypothetical protein
MNRDKNEYIALTVFADTEEVVSELELWINSEFAFLMMWEQLCNSDFDFETEDIITLDVWLNSNCNSMYIEDGVYYLHTHILFAFSISEPIEKIKLISTIFNLDNEILRTILTGMYNNN